MALLLLLLLAPDGTHELKYRFEKGMTSEDDTTREFKLELIAGEKLVVNHLSTTQVIVREVREVGRDGRPSIERVSVKKFGREIHAAGDRKAGTETMPSEGKTFVWRKGKLYVESGEVTKKFPTLVSRLQNWRDARLPGKAVKAGESWEVSAKTFLETVGQAAPESVKGKAVFTLEAVKDGIAKIPFRFEGSYKDGESTLSFAQEGVWRFDVKNGRDVELTMSAKIKVTGPNQGAGWMILFWKGRHRLPWTPLPVAPFRRGAPTGPSSAWQSAPCSKVWTKPTRWPATTGGSGPGGDPQRRECSWLSFLEPITFADGLRP